MKKIEKIIELLEKSGSSITDKELLKEEAISLLSKNKQMLEIFDNIADNIKRETECFLSKKNEHNVDIITGISMGIYLPNHKQGGYKLKIVGGEKSRDVNLNVNEDTMFDVASITKLFTLILLFHLEEKGIVDLNSRIVDVNPDFPQLQDYTFNDLIRLHGILKTDGNVATAESKEEAYNRLKTLYIDVDDKTQNTYTDFGAIVISDTLEKIVSQYLNKDLSFAEIMDMYLLRPLGLENTKFNPKGNNISGNGYDSNYVHDPKARKLEGAVGSAGIFTTSEDLATLAKNLYTINNYNERYFLSAKNLSRLGEITFPNAKQSNKGNLGIYVKHPLGFEKTFTPPDFSTGSFSHQGWTGALATFDPTNKIHQSILVNAIYNNDDPNMVRNNKPVGYGDAFDAYLTSITKHTMLLYLIKIYYSRYLNKSLKEEINETINIIK